MRVRGLAPLSDVIALSHAEAADADELEMLEAMLGALNPSAAVVRRSGRGESHGEGGGGEGGGGVGPVRSTKRNTKVMA